MVWQGVKKGRNTINMEEVIRDLAEKAKQQKDPNYIEKQKQQRKERRETLKKEYHDRMHAHFLQYIYLRKDQCEYFDENLDEINKAICDHSDQVEEIEKKLLQINKKRVARRVKKLKNASLSKMEQLKAGMSFSPVREED